MFVLMNIFAIFANPVYATDPEWIMPDPIIKIPGIENLKDMKPSCTEPDGDGKIECTMPWLNTYIAGAYKYIISTAAILAALVMMFAGFLWVTAGGNQNSIGKAKQMISGALTGMVLAFSSYIILYFVNPDLIKLNPIKVEKIVKVETDKPAIERYKDCAWESECSIGKGISDDHCDENLPHKEDDSCCCRISPLPGCAWTSGSCTGNSITSNLYNCGSKYSIDLYNCCCPKISMWQYDRGIETQIIDESFSLSLMLNCLRENMPLGVGRISSISDSEGLERCRDNYAPPCAHSQNSCHYGGINNSDGSYAVDLGDEENKEAILSAIQACGDYVENYLDENNHIHISAKGCRGEE